MYRFGLEEFGNAAIWAFEGTGEGPADDALIVARRGDETVISDDQFPP